MVKVAPPIVRNSVAIDDWVCYDGIDPPADNIGNVYVLTSLDGWWGGLAPRATVVDRPMADGGFDGPAPSPGRTVTVAGALLAVDRPGLLRGMDTLAAILAGQNRRGALIVTEAIVPVARTSDVRLGGATMVKRTGPLSAEFSVIVYAADPRRYALAPSVVTMSPYLGGLGRHYPMTFRRTYGTLGSTGRINAHNAGSQITLPVITFNGPCANPIIASGDASTALWLRMTLLAGESVTLDCNDRTVIFGGATRRQFLDPTSQWLDFEPGDNPVVFDTDTGNGTATVSWRDAWA